MSGSNIFEMELLALRSIYENDLHVEGGRVIIRVHPMQNDPKNEVDAQIDLEVACPENYPEMLPNITFKNCRGLSNKQIDALKSELETLVNSLKGKPMIYDLACHVLNYLLDNNRPHRKSFYDEMICRKQQEEANFKLLEDKRMRKIYDVQRKVQMKMEESNSSDDEDAENKKTVTASFDDYGIQLENDSSGESKTQCVPSFCCCSKYIHFEKKVLRGHCTDHLDCSTTYCALDTTSGEQLTIHEWNLKTSQRMNEIEKIIKSIQNELNYLKTLSHENLNSYVDFKCVTERDEWTVYIAEKYVSDVTLKTIIQQKWIFDLDIVRNMVKSILHVLLYLHNHKVVHKDLNDALIYFNKTGKLKIASYSVVKRMNDVYRLCCDEVVPDLKADPKNDVKQLGFILRKILELTAKSNDQLSVTDPKIVDFKDFVDKCLIKKEEKRWGAKDLLDHKFLKNNLSYESSGKRKSSYSRLSFDGNDETQDQFDFSVPEQNSRLLKDFHILEDIGKGSFGKVLKVRNKLDRQIYAIKEIKLDTNIKQLDKKIIGEVKLLSKLKHENVVRYYTSWIETYSEADDLIINKTKDDEEEEEGEDEEEEEEDDDDEESSDDGFWQKNGDQDDSSFVVFESQKGSPSSRMVEKGEDDVREIQPSRIMYIQMEFCEKSTLKYAINNNLYDQEARCWRLLREIVEGLTYIHEQGLIHRDLKPDNIFLDSNDNVKIGDFGLAKIRGMPKCTLIITEVSLGGGDNDSSLYTLGDSDTLGVGTSYYVAPEMNRMFEKSHYNEKVDIYSLGIIFFEMCHPPFNTGMERHDVLMKLRKTEIIIPPAMEEKLPRQMELVRMLLNRNPASRPTSKEILEDYVPPPEVEYEELKEIVKKTLMSPETKGYKYLISSCLNQKMNIDDEIAYQLQNFHSDQFHISLEMAKEPIEKVFKSHGAVFLSSSLLLPQNEIYSNIDGRVKLMTQSGAVVNLPYDLRVPFARYVTSKNIRRFRRYTVDRILREQKIHGVLPKELYECAFDIISPKSGNFMDEWEILSVIDEVVNTIPSLKNRHCVLVLNDAIIFRALLVYCNVEKLYSEIFKFLLEAKINKYGKRQLETNLLSLELGTQVVNTLINFFGKEESVYALKEELLLLFNNREDAYEKAEKGFSKLIKIIEEAENFGINVPIKVRLGVVCNTEYCSGIMFDLVCKTKQKRGKLSTAVVMSGCNYDGLLQKFRKMISLANPDIKETSQSAIGVSISLDKIASFIKEDNLLSERVVVCSTDYLIPNNVKNSFIRELRESGIKCYFDGAVDNMEELLEFCEENRIMHIVNLKEENGLVLVMSWDSSKCRYREKKISKREVAEYILKNSRCSEDQLGIGTYQRSDSRTSSTEIPSGNPSFNIHIILTDEKSSIFRRKYENQIRSKISPVLRYFSPKSRIEVVGVELDEGEMARLAICFKHDDTSYMSKILASADRSSKKSYLSKICAKLESFFTSEKSNVLIMVYGLAHDKYQFVIG